jgi:hypothetical protein
MPSPPPQDALDVTAALKAAGFAEADVASGVAAALPGRNATEMAGSLLAPAAFPDTGEDALRALLGAVSRFTATDVATAVEAYFPSAAPPVDPVPVPEPGPPPPPIIIMEKEDMTTLLADIMLFPKGSETVVGMSQQSPGPFPCPGGDICSPFGTFGPPAPGTKRAYRLKAVYFDENAGGDSHIQITFSLVSGVQVVFNLPRVCSGGGASNFHYSDWYSPDPIDGSHGRVTAQFVGSAPYNNSAGVYSLILEAHDLLIYDGFRIRNDDDGAIYLMLDGAMRHIPNPDIYWRLFRTEDYRHCRGIAPYPVGEPLSDNAVLVKCEDNPKVYMLVDNVKRWIASAPVFERFGFDWGKIQIRQPDELRAIADGADIH